MKRIVKLLAIATLTLLITFSIQTLPLVRAESPPALVQTGKQHYDAGRFAEAAQVLRQAAQSSVTAGDPLKHSQILALLSLAYQKLGQWQAAQEAIQTGLQLLEMRSRSRESHQRESIRGQVFTAQGHWQFATGNPEAALKNWQTAQVLYANVGDVAGVIGSQINQAQAMQAIGLYRRARQLLDQLEQQVVRLPDSALKLAGLHSLGNLRRQGGDLEPAKQLLTQARSLAKALRLPEDESKILISLGNTEHLLAGRSQDFENPEGAERFLQQAFTYYSEAADRAASLLTRTQAHLNQLRLQLETQSSPAPQALIDEIAVDIDRLPASRTAIDAQVNFAYSLLQLNHHQSRSEQIALILNTAIRQADQLQDPRAASSALGTLGLLYERRAEWPKAITTTRRALQIAQSINAPDLSYQWQWQMGRLLQAQVTATHPAHSTATPAQTPMQSEAIAYYREALQTLKALRSDLVALNPDIQFSFRERVEPVYWQYVDLLLRTEHPTQSNLIAARQTIEALQLAELDNFFQDACARPQAIDINNLDPTAAIIYPILLPDRLEVIVKLPGDDNLRHVRQPGVSEVQVDRAVEQLRRSLTRRSTSLSQVKQDARPLYNWLLKPFEADLQRLVASTSTSNSIKTLVFVLDGSLQNIPPAVLYDGEHYLIERYAIAVTPGLQLLDPKPLPRTALNVLIAGAANAPSFEKEGFAELNNVAIELAGIADEVNRSQKLQDQQFVKENIQTQIDAQSFNIVHIATHGQFSSNPEQTFILDWNQRIQVKDLDTLFRVSDKTGIRPIELLILSACETATGDRRAALGLAGIAIRAGTRSTLATLFQVNDASTAELMIRFYDQLNNPQLTKVEALRRAQLSFLREATNGENAEFARPYFWAPFILVGNWL